MAIKPGRAPGSRVVEFEQGGIRVFRRMPRGTTLQQAREYETKLRRDIFDETALGRREELTLPAAFGYWLAENRRKSPKSAATEARQWAEYIEGRRVSEAPEIAEKAILAWRKSGRTHQRPGAPKSAAKSSTINRRLACLKAVLRHAHKMGRHPINLSPGIVMLKEPPAKDLFLTKPQVAAWASRADAQTKAAIWLMAYTGLRVSELLAQPGGAKDSLTVADGKTGKRIVPVAPAARKWLKHLPIGLSYWVLRNRLNAARDAAKLPPGATAHTLRHTCASWLINEGVDLYTVARILGDTMQTAQRYAHLVTDTLARAVGRLR